VEQVSNIAPLAIKKGRDSHIPFIKQYRRTAIDAGLMDLLREMQPGDLCYVHYKKMVDKWKANPRWTTAHEIYRDLYYAGGSLGHDDSIARDLAWQVFFIKYVMRYEDQKELENGTI
jgi:hypothetical protein